MGVPVRQRDQSRVGVEKAAQRGVVTVKCNGIGGETLGEFGGPDALGEQARRGSDEIGDGACLVRDLRGVPRQGKFGSGGNDIERKQAVCLG